MGLCELISLLSKHKVWVFVICLFLFFMIEFLCVTALTVLSFTDQADLKPREIHLPLASKSGIKVCVTLLGSQNSIFKEFGLYTCQEKGKATF